LFRRHPALYQTFGAPRSELIILKIPREQDAGHGYKMSFSQTERLPTEDNAIPNPQAADEVIFIHNDHPQIGSFNRNDIIV
jgi:hypothetical protein